MEAYRHRSIWIQRHICCESHKSGHVLVLEDNVKDQKHQANLSKCCLSKTSVRSKSTLDMFSLKELAMSLRKSLYFLLAFVCLLNLSDGSKNGYCQVYSYNIKYRMSGLQEKHLFVCCNNQDEKQCEGATYQKPSRAEAFCSGEVLQDSGNHWTQMETSAFPQLGHFYCGGCCGQHIAWDKCTEQHNNVKRNVCINWVQCFQRQCMTVLKAVLNNKPLKCTLPPPPHPKHYIYVPPRLPANMSAAFRPSRPPATSVDPQHNATAFKCGKEECELLEMDRRCTISCCYQYCCLPDGPLPYPRGDRLLLGLSTVQVVGIAIGAIALLIVIVSIVMLVVKRMLPGCKNFHFSSPHDTQVLVIEGPEDGDSDMDDEDEDDDDDEEEDHLHDERHEEESA